MITKDYRRARDTLCILNVNSGITKTLLANQHLRAVSVILPKILVVEISLEAAMQNYFSLYQKSHVKLYVRSCKVVFSTKDWRIGCSLSTEV